MPGKLLFVVTSSSRLGNSGKDTGWFLPEVAHPYEVVKEAGYDVLFVSPKGGKSPCDPGSIEKYKDDAVCQAFLATDGFRLNNTLKPCEVNPSDFVGIFYAGGYGPMFDLPDNEEIAKVAASIYESGGVVSTLCHGPCGLVNVKLSTGELLIKGKTITGFSNAEEEAVKLQDVMPFLLETRLRECGANFESGESFKPNVKVCGRLVSGQNPASGTPMAKELVKVLKAQESKPQC